MGGVPGGRDEGRTRRGGLAVAIGVAVLIGGAAAVYVIGHHGGKPGLGADLRPLAKGEMAKLSISAGAAAPVTPFLGADGKAVTLKTNALGLYRGHISKAVLPDDVQISCVKSGYKQTKTNRRSPPGGVAMFIETECTMQRQ